MMKKTIAREAKVEYVIGIDVGTSGTKGLLVREDGTTAATALAEYGLDTPRPGWAEQDPASWWQAASGVIAQLAAAAGTPEAIKCIGLTGQMHSSVFLDHRDEVIRPALLWCDQRTEDQVRAITEKVGFERLVDLTANRALTGFTAPKILWLREVEPKNYSRLRRLLLAKDYIRSRLTGDYATDVSDASGMLLFDVVRRRWSREVLDRLEIDPDILPEVFESPQVTGSVMAAVAADLGLAPGTPVVAGGGDQAAGAVGNGIVREGPCLITIGTSGVVFAVSTRPVIDPEARLHSFCHAAPGLWHTMGVMLSAGGSLRWLRETLRQAAPDLDYDRMGAAASTAPAGSDGLFFLPYLTGERTPHFDAEARGMFFGLSLTHGLGHLVRAVMEGVAYGLLDSVRLMREAGADMDAVYLSGGGGKSDLWASIMASALGLPVKRLSVDEGPSYGAAALALVGAGVYPDVAEVAARGLKVRDEVMPDPALVPTYAAGYCRYRSLYPAVAGLFRPGTES